MKNLKNLGKTLSKAEQKEVLGGGKTSFGSYYSMGCIDRCSNQCPQLAWQFGSSNWACVNSPSCSNAPTLEECRIFA